MPPANRPGDQFDTLVVVRHKPVLEDSLKPSRLCRVSGRNGGQSSDPADYPVELRGLEDDAPLAPTRDQPKLLHLTQLPINGLSTRVKVSDGQQGESTV